MLTQKKPEAHEVPSEVEALSQHYGTLDHAPSNHAHIAEVKHIIHKPTVDPDLHLTEFWELDGMYVSTAYQRRGIGQTMLIWGLKQAQLEGVPIVTKSSPVGVYLYEKNGFRSFERQRFEPFFDPGHKGMHSMIWEAGDEDTCVCSFTFLANYGIGGLAPAFYKISIEYEKTLSETSNLLIWPILVFGVFNFLWVPIANYIGKRPVFVFANLLLCVSYIWGATSTSFDSLLWSNIVGAFAGSSTETLGAAMVNDLYFTHERASKMSIYMNSIAGGNTIGPLICGFVVESLGWRWHKRMAAIFTGVTWLVIFFFCPETRFDREESSQLSWTAPDATIRSYDRDGAQTDPEKVMSTSEKIVSQSPPGTPLATPPENPSSTSIPQKSWVQQLSLWSGVPKDTSLIKLFVRPFPLIVYPAVILAFLGYAITLAAVVAVNILNSFVLQAPPYNWRPSVNGLINIPGFLGNLFGAWAGGWLVDRYSSWRSKKNGGVFESESRLTLLVVPGLVVPAGCLVFGYGVQEVLNWTSLFFGYAMIAVGLTAVPCITMTYVSDSYLPVAPDALLLVNGLKNIVAFGFLYGVVPWVTTVGYVSSFGTMAGLIVFVLGLAIPLSMFGRRIRHETSSWRIVLQ
ncbi:hypothetical protein MBLNU459_g6651t1 [Dothideomycetes sp. NU459]